MGILSDWFDVDPETEKDIKDVIIAVGLIAILIGGATSRSLCLTSTTIYTL